MHSKHYNRTPPYPKGRIVVLDVETSGLDPFHGARIFCWGYITELGEYGFMMKTERNLRWVRKLFADSSKHIIFHHAKFDLKLFTFEDVDVFNAKAQFHCTLVMAKLLNENFQHDLAYLSIRYLNRDPGVKNAVDEWLATNRRRFVKEHGRKPNFSDIPIELVKARCLWDVESTLWLYGYLAPRIAKSCSKLYETERMLMLVCVDMELTGLMVDLTRIRKLKKRAERDAARILCEMEKLVCPLTIKKKKKDEFVEVTVEQFNPRSSSLQLPAAFRKLGIELKYKTKPKKGKKHGSKSGGGNWSFDEYAMIRYVSRPLAAIIRASGEESWPASKFHRCVKKAIKKHKLPKKELLPPLILKYRELTKMVSTYYDNLLEMATNKHTLPDGREVGIIHCSFNQSEAMTGRFSCSKPNLQNMPRLMGPRECFIPRPNRRNWHLDYKQIEMKMFAHFARDKKMAAAIDKDVHLMVAVELYEVPPEEITKEQRKRAKGTNFGILYGSGPRKQAETLTRRGLPTSEMEATQLVARYHRKFPSVRATTNQMKMQLIRNGSVANPYGRRYHIPTRFAYKILNYMCQGTSADIIKKAMVDLWRWLRAHDKKTKILLTNHDELGLECPPEEEHEVITKALEIMENRTKWFVPITVDAEVVTERWSEKHKPSEVGCSFINAA